MRCVHDLPPDLLAPEEDLQRDRLDLQVAVPARVNEARSINVIEPSTHGRRAPEGDGREKHLSGEARRLKEEKTR